MTDILIIVLLVVLFKGEPDLFDRLVDDYFAEDCNCTKTIKDKR